MIEEGVEVAMLGKTSHGLYAGRFMDLMARDYASIVNESLTQEITRCGKTRGNFFKRVIIADRPASTLVNQLLHTSYWGN